MYGVWGVSNGATRSGVFGENRAGGFGGQGSTTGGVPAIFGANTGTGDGVWGVSNNLNGVLGRSQSAFARGVYGENTGGFGVAGRTTSADVGTSGVYGENNGAGPAVFGRSVRYPAVYGEGPTEVAWPGIGGVGHHENTVM